MSLDWRAFMELADRLYTVAQQATSEQRQREQQGELSPSPGSMSPNLIETYYRAAASRAYYSVFLQAREKVNACDGVFYDGGDCHAALQVHLSERSRRNGAKKIGARLKTLHTERKRADYDVQLPVSPANLANKTICEAKKTKADIEQVYGP